jgi:hypothetical protein
MEFGGFSLYQQGGWLAILRVPNRIDSNIMVAECLEKSVWNSMFRNESLRRIAQSIDYFPQEVWDATRHLFREKAMKKMLPNPKNKKNVKSVWLLCPWARLRIG